MAKSTLSFVCQNCGAAYNRWQGKCESCGEWNTLAEEDTSGSTSMPVSIRSKRKGRLFALETLTGKSFQAPRTDPRMGELAPVTVRGHVTKDGQIAGPRVVEHMVDAVLSFEGEGSQQFRILRAVKNRFGPTDEIGVFEMTGLGLREVANPSELFLSERDLGSPGTAVFAGIEGTRPVLVELQALVAPTSLGTPRRAVVGWDPNRLSMVLAVLEAHCGVKLSGHDVYLNVAGGLRIQEPAADLAAAAALVSSLVNAPLPTDAVYFGEISLSGAVRPVAQTSARLKEAAKLGFGRAVLPQSPRGDVGGDAGLVLSTVGGLTSLVADIAARGSPRANREGGAAEKNATPARFRHQEG